MPTPIHHGAMPQKVSMHLGAMVHMPKRPLSQSPVWHHKALYGRALFLSTHKYPINTWPHGHRSIPPYIRAQQHAHVYCRTTAGCSRLHLESEQIVSHPFRVCYVAIHVPAGAVRLRYIIQMVESMHIICQSLAAVIHSCGIIWYGLAVYAAMCHFHTEKASAPTSVPPANQARLPAISEPLMNSQPALVTYQLFARDNNSNARSRQPHPICICTPAPPLPAAG